MKVLMCASEGTPFVKTGGLADVIGALPLALKEENVDVRVILPYYKKIKEKNVANYVGYAYVTIFNRSEYVGVFETKVNDITYYFIDGDIFFNRDNLYGFGDDGGRFAYFNFAVLEALKVVNFFPDVIHVNDWQTGLIPYILKSNYWNDERYNHIKTIFSIHNIQYQGQYGLDFASLLYMPYSDSNEFGGRFNFMKSAIMNANIINTVSNTYKQEVLSPEYSYGLDGVLGMRYYDFYGILNGLDVKRYDPKTDPYIYANYSVTNHKSKKKENKKALLEEFGLEGVDKPLFTLVSRLADQKGIDLLMPIMDDVINYSNANFILMGSGDSYFEDYFRSLEYRYPNRFKSYIGYNDSIAQKLYAGSDIFLMPSKFEPCGLGQMIAMRYGTLPLVRETGGLRDTVIPYNQYTGEGTGFSFSHYNPYELKDVMFMAIDLYNNNRPEFEKMVNRVMKLDFSWKRSALEYIKLYKKLMGE